MPAEYTPRNLDLRCGHFFPAASEHKYGVHPLVHSHSGVNLD